MANHEVLVVDCGGDHDGIARGCEGNRMTDCLAGCGRRCAGVAVTPAHPIDVPCAGRGG